MEFNPNHRGNVAELKIAAAAAELGVPVLAPMTEHERYDLVFEIGNRLLRIQCKSGRRKGDVIVVRLVTNRRGPDGFIRGRYTDDEIDAVAVYCPELDECYLLTMEYINGLPVCTSASRLHETDREPGYTSPPIIACLGL